MIKLKYNKTKLEGFADAMTHGIGLIFSIIGFIILILSAAKTANTWIFIGFSIYGISLISTYLSSTIYHLYLYYHPIPNKHFKRILLLFDHCSIFFLIAGSYTPILLVFMRNTLGWSLFSLIWFLTFAGMLYKLKFIGKFKRFSLFMYLSMGWLILLSINDLINLVPINLIWFLLIGGIFYTVGIIFYQKKSIYFNHAIWHMFVLIGSIIHFLGIIFFIN
ncbi:hemolysin D [bacterium]|nr:hemolysin D [bacterium]|tara:strand:+ start:4928 stop:5587 length:660 start_codon:yes stop_codon:yes gene_type:complete